MKFGIFTNINRDKDLIITKRLIDILNNYGHRISIDEDTAHLLGMPEVEDASLSEILFVLGGDGTILRAARKYGQYSIPIVGINVGHLGFMSELNIDETPAFLDAVERGEYIIDERMMLEAHIKNGSELQLCALNDIVITRANRTNMVRLNVYIDGELTDNFSGDGLIVATPTGSTAYSLAAGGPIVAPNLKCIIITPVCGHSLYARSIVVDDKCEIRITPGESEDDIAISADGTDNCVKSGEVQIIINCSEMTTKFVRTKKDTFFPQLQTKLAQWKVY